MSTRRSLRLRAAAVLALSLSGEARAGDVAFGEYLAGECVTCHKVDGSDNGIPGIVGWPVDQFSAVMMAYRGKVRDHAAMQTIAGRLSDDEVKALAAYFKKLGPKRDAVVTK